MKVILAAVSILLFLTEQVLCDADFDAAVDGDSFLDINLQAEKRDAEPQVGLKRPHLEYDPCETTACGRGRECEVNPLGEAVCICQKVCKKRKKPVCGSDGHYYINHCELHRAACLSGATIVIDHDNNCLKKNTNREKTPKPSEAAVVFELDPEETTTQTFEPESESSSIFSQRECSGDDYETMKENLLVFVNDKIMNNKKTGNEYLVSIMFSHYDLNKNGQLEAEELWQAAEKDHLGQLSSSCILADMLLFDDLDKDGKLNINEFYLAFSVSLVSLEKSLEVNHVVARVGDNLEIKCDVSGTPPPPIVWRRNDMDLSKLNDDEIKVTQIFVDGSLYLTNVQLVHAGNYTCHAQRNKDVVQTHVLHVQTLLEVHVVPKLQSRAPGELAEMECHVIGVPQPRVYWLKNDEELKMGSGKYTIIGNSTSLVVGKITYSDTGAYMCVATNPTGTMRDITSLVVQDQPARSSPGIEHRFFVFHDWGVSVYEPANCRLFHQIQSTDVIPGTQEYVCGDRGLNCSWGAAINVADRYIYASQPNRDRILIISRVQMVVVDAVVTDKFPVALHYVPNLDQVWVLCWRGYQDKGTKTIQIIRDASQKKKHHTVHPEPVDGHFDLVSSLFVPAAQDLGHGWRYGYVVHTNQRGLYKLDLKGMKYLKSVDLTPYNCAPKSADFASFGGLVILECLEPLTEKPTGQIVMDYLTDTVIEHSTTLLGRPYVSPDSRRLVTIRTEEHSVLIVAQEITEEGLRFLFDVKTTLQISDVAFFPSRTTHSYDLYATSASKEDLLFVDLSDGKVEMITGVGRPSPSPAPWGAPNRPVAAAGVFGAYLATAAQDALFVVNGKTRTVNCEIGSVIRPRVVVWVRAP